MGWWFRRGYDSAYLAALDAFVEVFDSFRDRLIEPDSAISHIRFDWDPSVQVGAIASRMRNRRDIRVALGCWSRVQGLSNILMACNDVAPWFGDACTERVSLDDWARFSQIQPQPQAESRIEAANVLAETTLMMIFMHELGHHVLGHLDRNKSHSKAKIVESKRLWLSWSNRSSSARLVQWQEVCADRFAISGLRYLIHTHGNSFPDQLLGHELDRHLGRVVPFAHLIMLLSLPGHEIAMSRYAKATHPHPLVRILASQDFSENDGKRDDDEKELVRLLRASYYAELGIEEWEKILTEASGFAKECLGYQPSPDELGRQYDLSSDAWHTATAHGSLKYRFPES